MRHRVPWLLSVPLMLAGTETAHWLAFRLVYPNPWERAQALAQSGHGYFAYWPMLAGAGSALVIAALVMQAISANGNRAPGRARRPSPAVFAALPPLAFAVQEHLEVLLHSGTVAGVADTPTFVIGVVLTLPFGLVAYGAAGLLLRVARAVGRAFARSGTPREERSLRCPRPPCCALLPPRCCLLASGHAQRGPPRGLSASVA